MHAAMIACMIAMAVPDAIVDLSLGASAGTDTDSPRGLQTSNGHVHGLYQLHLQAAASDQVHIPMQQVTLTIAGALPTSNADEL